LARAATCCVSAEAVAHIVHILAALSVGLAIAVVVLTITDFGAAGHIGCVRVIAVIAGKRAITVPIEFSTLGAGLVIAVVVTPIADLVISRRVLSVFIVTVCAGERPVTVFV